MDQEPIRLLLVDLPPGAGAHELAYALPLGGGAAVCKRLAELLPGATFDASGRGSFRRGHYQIEFSMAGEEPTRIEVALDRAEAFVALQRIVTKTGWRAVDPFQGAFVDLDASAASGAVVTVAPAVAAPQVVEDETPSWRRWAGRAALLIVVVGTTLLAWMWSQRAPTMPIPEAGVPKLELLKDLPPEMAEALVMAAQPPDLPAGAPPPGLAPGASPADVEAARAAWMQQAQLLRARLNRIKVLAPEFREAPAVHQLLDYLHATTIFRTEFATDAFMRPEQLADKALFARFSKAPYLPAFFGEPEREGYRFEFTGECGQRSQYFSDFSDLCQAFVYVARPVSPAPDATTFALLSTDLRVHYRRDAETPSGTDPTVDNTAPSTAADLPGGAPETPQPEPEGLMGSLLRTLRGLIDRALGPGGVKQATAELHEATAVDDLRAFSAAEIAFSVTVGNGLYFLPPDQLADASLFTPLGLQPFLEARFIQPLRLGYRFEFLGEQPETGQGSSPRASRACRRDRTPRSAHADGLAGSSRARQAARPLQHPPETLVPHVDRLDEHHRARAVDHRQAVLPPVLRRGLRHAPGAEHAVHPDETDANIRALADDGVRRRRLGGDEDGVDASGDGSEVGIAAFAVDLRGVRIDGEDLIPGAAQLLRDDVADGAAVARHAGDGDAFGGEELTDAFLQGWHELLLSQRFLQAPRVILQSPPPEC